MTQEQSPFWANELTKMGALWIHDGNPKRPHVKLTSGKCSNGFFNGSKVIENPCRLKEICTLILANNLNDLVQQGSKRIMIDRVVGSAFGAITMAHVMASLLKAKTGFTEDPDQKKERMELKRFSVVDEETLVVEDVVTTGDTTRKTIEALEEKGARVLPVIVALVNRSGMTNLDGRKIVAFIDHPMPMWEPEECPLCKQGSEPLRPKGNWDALNADY